MIRNIFVLSISPFPVSLIKNTEIYNKKNSVKVFQLMGAKTVFGEKKNTSQVILISTLLLLYL